jgi:hypothetical protein
MCRHLFCQYYDFVISFMCLSQFLHILLKTFEMLDNYSIIKKSIDGIKFYFEHPILVRDIMVAL